MYKSYYSLKSIPFAKENNRLYENNNTLTFKSQFTDLANSGGIGLLTGDSGSGKTSAIRYSVNQLNPHIYKIFYISESHFTNYDIYRQMGTLMGVTIPHRFAELWRSIKEHIKSLVEIKSHKVIIIIDEAQNLRNDFLKNFPAFLNYEYDARDMLTVWFVGLSSLKQKLKQNDVISLSSRIKVKCNMDIKFDFNSFSSLLEQEFKSCGCLDNFLSKASIDLLFTATKGNFRVLNNIITESLRIGAHKKEINISDETIIKAIEVLQN